MAGNKKVVIAAVSSLLLVAMVVALMYNGRNNGSDDVDVAAHQKAMTTINTLCSNTDYKDACVNTLKDSGNNTSDPKELIEVAFTATIKQIQEAVENSTLLEDVERDPRGKAALDGCRELADRAVNDLNRTFSKFSDKFNEFDLRDANNVMGDLKIWLSGAITNQETCLDGFESVNGDAGEKMKELLNLSMQMSSNGLAMMTGIQSILASFGVSAGAFSSVQGRRLLSEDVVMGHEDEIPSWIDPQRRKLLSDKPKGHKHVKPDLVVAKDGSGDFKTINEALYEIPKNREKTFVVYIKEGVYEEQVRINSSFTNVLIVGDGPKKTRITGKLNFIDGTPTYQSATFAVHGDNFMAMDIGFENYAGPEKHQAVALRVSADLAIFYNCHMDGYQDTLYTHTYRQFYRDCTISGTIDFIFGDAAAVFQGCTMVVRKPLDNQYCIVTAQGRKDVHQPTGLVLQNCSIVSDPAYYPVKDVNKAYLGRPWKLYSRTVVMESFIDDLIQPDGWLAWNETFALDTLFYTEFNNRGPGSPKSHRIKWPGVKELPGKRIKRFTADEFIDGRKWVKKQDKVEVPYEGGFFFDVPKDDPNADYSPEGSAETKDLGRNKGKDSYVTPKVADSPGGAPVINQGGHIAAAPWMEPYEDKEKTADQKKHSDDHDNNDEHKKKSSHDDDEKHEKKEKSSDDDDDKKNNKSSDDDEQKENKKSSSSSDEENNESSDANTMTLSAISATPAPAQISPSSSPSPSPSPSPAPNPAVSQPESSSMMSSVKNLFFRG